MKYFNTLIPLILIVIITGCKSTQQTAEKEEQITMDNSKTSLDWNGYYVGTIPCADCPGIKTELELNTDQTFILKETYMERDVAPRVTEGSFDWNRAGNAITLNLNGKRTINYLVGENTLIQLDVNGNRVTGNLADRFKLQKKQIEITDTRWKLVELNGQKVVNSKVFVIFSTEKNQVYGNSGCNRFTGSFELGEGNRLALSQIASTRMACMDMDTEQTFLPVLGMVDNYSISGGILSLNKARMAPLARFEIDLTKE